jgi:exopolysaccharide biosynthesis protein
MIGVGGWHDLAGDGGRPSAGAERRHGNQLRALARRLGLVNALNLDGGGSTTMWVQGQVLNRPSDPTGPRKVSDALLVYGGKQ